MPRSIFKKGTVANIVAVHSAGLEYWSGTGSRLWGTDENNQFHAVRVIRPRVGTALVQHDCGALREALTKRRIAVAAGGFWVRPVPNLGEAEALDLVLALACWDCSGSGPTLPIDESLTGEAISGFALIPEEGK